MGLGIFEGWVERSGLIWAELPGSGVGESLGAGSPFTSYTAAVVVYVLLAAVLITGLLIGAFLLINLGLLSKRREDRVGHRDPSDATILQGEVWPDEPAEFTVLPAEEQEPEIQIQNQGRSYLSSTGATKSNSRLLKPGQKPGGKRSA
jgi:hypothetical protein